MAVDDFADIAAGEFAVIANLELVGIDVVDAVAALQVFAEIGEATAEDGNLVATALEDGHQSVGTLGNGQVLGNVLHDADVESLE